MTTLPCILVTEFNLQMDFTRYLSKVVDYYDDNYPVIRWGQAYMNVLYDVCPKFYKDLTSTPLDPFYDDSKISDFIDYTFHRWEMYNQ